MPAILRLFLAAVVLVVSAGTALADLPGLRVTVLKVGTVSWELDTIRHHGLDAANGFRMQVDEVAGNAAAQVAFQAGATDVIVSDWLWVARQRAAGHDFMFIPYSKAVGGVMVPGDSGLTGVAQLVGARIGIAGGPLDKSWLILRAYALQEHGIDLAETTEPVFAAPPLIFKAALEGDVQAAVNYWHFMAKMEVAGMKTLLDIKEAALALGLDPDTPLLGYVMRGEMLRERPELVQGLATASRAAKSILARDEAEWERLRPQMNVATDAEFSALVAGFRAGVPAPGPVDEAAADRMLRLLARIGGAALVGGADRLPEGVFVDPGS